MLTSVVIRTYNEQRFLEQLLDAVSRQQCDFSDIEIVLVDSGSTDDTLAIAGRFDCRITHIKKEEFSFGRSLNIGCEYADGDYLVFISGHCIPEDERWVENLVRPLVDNKAAYSYGRQKGKFTTKFSESQHFEKAFPAYSKIPQDGYFCNNANAAVSREAWARYQFNEVLTGLEDMYLAKELEANGEKIAYVADASVFHIHDETWPQVMHRYEREAYALHQIMPQVHFTLGDFLRYFISGVLADTAVALGNRVFLREFPSIFMFRLLQYWGTYRGNREVRELSAKMKHRYFYPKDVEKHLYE